MEIIIKGELTSLNEYINAERRNRFLGAKIKKVNTELVLLQLPNLKIEKYPVHIHIDWYTKNERKDPDNTAFSKKYILDAMVTKKILENDTRKHISGFSDSFHVGEPQCVISIK